MRKLSARCYAEDGLRDIFWINHWSPAGERGGGGGGGGGLTWTACRVDAEVSVSKPAWANRSSAASALRLSATFDFRHCSNSPSTISRSTSAFACNMKRANCRVRHVPWHPLAKQEHTQASGEALSRSDETSPSMDLRRGHHIISKY